MVTQSEPVDISITDHTFAIKIDAIYCGSGGTIIAALPGEVARTWLVQAGQYLLGRFVSVSQSGTTASSMIGITMPNRQ